MESLVEMVAKEMAIGNNGGNWVEHYKPEQRIVWRHRAMRVIFLVRKNLIDDLAIKCDYDPCRPVS